MLFRSLGGVAARRHFEELLAQSPVGVDHERRTLGDADQPARHPERRRDRVVGVADEREPQLLLLCELGVGVDWVDAATDDLRAECREVVQEAVELNGFDDSARCAVFGIEVKDGALAGRADVVCGAVV